jgi:hypothetical protein
MPTGSATPATETPESATPDDRDPIAAAEGQTLARAPAEVLHATYAWVDANDATGTVYRVAHTWDVERIRSAIDAFGAPESAFRYYIGHEAEHRSALEARGLTLDGHVVVPDYRSLVRQARPDVAMVVESVLRAAHEYGHDDLRSLIGIFAGLVQAGIGAFDGLGLPYRVPPDERVAADGTVLRTLGLMVPLEALTIRPSPASAGFGWGDCDTKSTAFLAMVTQLQGVRAVILLGREHAFVAVNLPPQQREHFVEHDGERFVILERRRCFYGLVFIQSPRKCPQKHIAVKF